MKIKPILADMSGRLQGIVASHNRGGQYFRGRTVPTTPPTAPQTNVRLILAGLVGTWAGSLTDAQRVLWNDYASVHQQINGFGDAVNIGGIGYFIKINLPCTLAGLPISGIPPVDSGGAVLTPPAASRSGANASIAFGDTDDWTAQGGALLIYASRPVQATRYSAAGIPLQFVTAILGDLIPPSSPQAVTLPWAWAAGQAMFFKYKCINPDYQISANYHERVIG